MRLVTYFHFEFFEELHFNKDIFKNASSHFDAPFSISTYSSANYTDPAARKSAKDSRYMYHHWIKESAESRVAQIRTCRQHAVNPDPALFPDYSQQK